MSIENFNDRSDIYRYFFFDTFPTQKVEIYFLFWASTVAFTNRLVRKPPLGPQNNNLIVREILANKQIIPGHPTYHYKLYKVDNI